MLMRPNLDRGKTNGVSRLHALITTGLLTVVLMTHLGCRTTDQDSDVMFYGADNRRGILTFETQLVYLYPEGWEGPAQALLDSEHRSDIDEQIQLQIAHMFAAFTTHPDFVESPGVTENHPTVEIKRIAKIPNEPAALITWAFRDTAVFHKKIWAGGNRQIKFWLPREVTTIYSKGFLPRGRKNWCTDSHYNSESDFWYFWNPFQENCPIQPERDLVRVTGHLSPLPSTTRTFPEYERLYGSNGNRRELKVVVLVGIDENFRAGDLGRQSFHGLVRLMKDNGYAVSEEKFLHCPVSGNSISTSRCI